MDPQITIAVTPPQASASVSTNKLTTSDYDEEDFDKTPAKIASRNQNVLVLPDGVRNQ